MSDAPRPVDRGLAPMIRLAPAKINLTLAVLARRADGYHDLHSIVAPLALADRLSVARANGPPDTLRVDGFDAGVTSDNLVLRAVSAARAALRSHVDAWPMAARLEKYIPVAAGLGGGSSDAAAVLDAIFDAWGVADELGGNASAALKAALAAGLGSDVPFFLADGPAVLRGRGEIVEALPPLRGTPPGVLLVTPAVATPTAVVFNALDTDVAATPPNAGSTRAPSEHLAHEWRTGMAADALVMRAGVLASANDLAAAADLVVPGLRALRRSLARRLGRPVGLSGSGPTLWVLYASRANAATAADAARAAVQDGSVVAPGAASPSIIATEFLVADRPTDRQQEGQGS